jgi:hypothetical protein
MIPRRLQSHEGTPTPGIFAKSAQALENRRVDELKSAKERAKSAQAHENTGSREEGGVRKERTEGLSAAGAKTAGNEGLIATVTV